MIQPDHSACRIANKVAMHLQYAATATDTRNAGPIVDEALLATLELLQLADLGTLSARYAQQCESLFSAPAESAVMAKLGAQWNANACQQLRDMGFQEKWITVLGNEMDQWNPSFVPPATLIHSIQRLATECSADATTAAHRLLAHDQSGSSAKPNLLRFSNAICGLAILLVTLGELEEAGSPENAGEFFVARALASFGTHLVVNHDLPPS